MAIKVKEGRWRCSYCNKEYDSVTKADSCRDAHDLVYVQLARSDVYRLLQFIFTKDDDVLTRSLLDSLRKIPLRSKDEIG